MWLEQGDGKTFRAPESFLGFCGTCDWGQGGGKTFWAPESFLGFCGAFDWGQGGGKTFWAPESFLGHCGTCDWGQGGGKTFWAPSFLGFCGTCDWGQGGGKNFWAPESFLGFCGTCDWGEGGGKNFWAPESFLGYCGTCDWGQGGGKSLHSWTESQESPVGTKTFPMHKRNNRSSKLFQSSKVFFQDGVANSVISISLIRGYQPRHLGWGRYSLPRFDMVMIIRQCERTISIHMLIYFMIHIPKDVRFGGRGLGSMWLGSWR